MTQIVDTENRSSQDISYKSSSMSVSGLMHFTGIMEEDFELSVEDFAISDSMELSVIKNNIALIPADDSNAKKRKLCRNDNNDFIHF